MKSKASSGGIFPSAFPTGNVFTRETVTAQFAHRIFYFKSQRFPSFGVQSVVKTWKISPRAKTPPGLPNTLHMQHTDVSPPHRESFICANTKLPQKHRFPTRKWGKCAFGAEKDQPSQENNPHLILLEWSTITEPLEASGIAGDVLRGAQ